MQAKVRALERRIENIKQKLTALGDLRPGSLSEQYNICGNPTCRCKADPPQKHGPDYQLSWTRKGRSRTRCVGRSELATVRRQRKSCERLRSLMDEWIELAIELSDLKFRQAKER